MLKTFKYRLYPTKEQQRLLERQLEECRWLYNHLLAERRVAWEQQRKSLRYAEQATSLPTLKTERPSLAEVHSQVLQNVVVRIELAFQAFFRRVKAGEEPGYPRFRGRGRYHSLTFPQVPVGCKLDSQVKRLYVTRVGRIKLILHRPLEGTPKTATISRSSTGKWYICFSCECAEPVPLSETGQSVGIDMGLETFAMLSTGIAIENPRFFHAEEHALAQAQRRLFRAEVGTSERAKRRQVVARLHERIAWRRGDFAHQHSRRLVNTFDLLAVEDLSVQRMMQNHKFAKSIQDAAWSQFRYFIASKAAWAGRRYVAVNPAHTSQDCSGCGWRNNALTLADRVYRCANPARPDCCLMLDRDINAARNILRVGQHSLASA